MTYFKNKYAPSEHQIEIEYIIRQEKYTEICKTAKFFGMQKFCQQSTLRKFFKVKKNRFHLIWYTRKPHLKNKRRHL